MGRLHRYKLSVQKRRGVILILAAVAYAASLFGLEDDVASWEPEGHRDLRPSPGGETSRRDERGLGSGSNRQLPPCARSWGTFERGKSLLTETQVIRRRHPPPAIDSSALDYSPRTGGFHSSKSGGFFFDPDANFAFCAIEKNGSSQWQTVLQNVLEKRTERGFRDPFYFLGRRSFYRHGKEKLKKILESPDSIVVVMVRDPLARFASAYLNKCFDHNCTNDLCLPRAQHEPKGRDSLVPHGQPISFRHALDWILGKRDVGIIEPHFRAQSARCSIKDGGLEKYFTVVGKMTEGSLSSDGDCIMEYANLSQYNIPAESESPLGGDDSAAPSTFWSTGGVLRFNHHGSTEKEEDNLRKLKEEDYLRKLFTKVAARELIEKFRQDYETFQLPEPEWIESATGEWMDSLDHHPCHGSSTQ